MATKFTRPQLTADGFVGWVTFDQLRNADPCPEVGGVYVVVCAGNSAPAISRSELRRLVQGSRPHGEAGRPQGQLGAGCRGRLHREGEQHSLPTSRVCQVWCRTEDRALGRKADLAIAGIEQLARCVETDAGTRPARARGSTDRRVPCRLREAALCE